MLVHLSTRPIQLPLRSTGPALRAEYFPNQHLDGPACRTTRSWGNVLQKPCGKANDFSARITGLTFITKPGLYEISLGSDDGSRMWIGKEKILDLWSNHPMESDSCLVRLAKGAYPIRIEFYQDWGAAMMSFHLSDFKTGKHIQPGRILRHRVVRPNRFGHRDRLNTYR